MDRLRLLVSIWLLLATMAAGAGAHPPESPSEREIVRLQGYVAEPGEGQRRIAMLALGKEHVFAAVDVRVFGVSAQHVADVGPTVLLQGAREDVFRVVSARPQQRVTILAERRHGSTELFVLTVDLCPER